MSKSILVVDTPCCCNECEFKIITHKIDGASTIKCKRIYNCAENPLHNYSKVNQRLTLCPLQEMSVDRSEAMKALKEMQESTDCLSYHGLKESPSYCKEVTDAYKKYRKVNMQVLENFILQAQAKDKDLQQQFSEQYSIGFADGEFLPKKELAELKEKIKRYFELEKEDWTKAVLNAKWEDYQEYQKLEKELCKGEKNDG